MKELAMTINDSDRSPSGFAELSSVELDCVGGGFGGTNPFQGVVTWFQNLFAPLINNVKGHIAGPMLAKKMYGQPSRAEKANGRQVMTDYFSGRFDPPARRRA
jgi:hypothetical protein